MSTGDEIRKRNKLKAKNLMALAATFSDMDTLTKIQGIFAGMSPADMERFKRFLNNRQYVRAEFANPKDLRIINEITKIALNTTPSDPFLNKAYKRYNENLEAIDQLKVKTVETDNNDSLDELLDDINRLNDENVALLEQVKAYSNKRFAS